MHTSGHHYCVLGKDTGEVSLKRILPIKYEMSLVTVVRGCVWNEKDLWPLPTFSSRQKHSNGFLWNLSVKRLPGDWSALIRQVWSSWAMVLGGLSWGDGLVCAEDMWGSLPHWWGSRKLPGWWRELRRAHPGAGRQTDSLAFPPSGMVRRRMYAPTLLTLPCSHRLAVSQCSYSTTISGIKERPSSLCQMPPETRGS